MKQHLRKIGAHLTELKWVFFTTAPLYLLFLVLFFNPHYTPIDPDGGHRYTFFSLSGQTMGIIILSLPLVILIMATALYLHDHRPTSTFVTVASISLITWGLFLDACIDNLNYRLDGSRTQITQAQILSASTERRNGRRGGDVYSAHLRVKLPDVREFSFMLRDNIGKYEVIKPTHVSFTLGRGFFNRPYVIQVEGY